MSIDFFQIHWAACNNWWLLFVIVGLFCLSIYRLFKIRWALAILGGRWQKKVVEHFQEYRHLVKAFFFAMSLLFLFLAFLHPQWDRREHIVKQHARDIMIALDISRSMLATDCEPNRIELAKNKIKQLLSTLEYERVGLILFSGSSLVQCPLTTDYNAFYMFLDAVDVETISQGSTALDSALKKSIDAFKDIPKSKSKIVVVFTDGEDFSQNLTEIKHQAQVNNLHIFTVGIGTPEGAPIPLFDQTGKQCGHQKNEHGSIVISQLNEQILDALSGDVGGVYIRVTQNSEDMHLLQSYIMKFEKEEFEDKKVNEYENKYHYFLFISLFFLLGEWVL